LSRPAAHSSPEYVRESNLLGAALAIAAEAHTGQVRANGSPYLSHPLRVCDLLAEAGAGERMLAAALLHDAVERSELEVGDVVDGFGDEAGALVAALTEDASIGDWVARKDALRAQVAMAGARAAAIYAADKLANLREMSELYDEHGESAIDLHKAPTLDLRVDAWEKDVEMIARIAPSLALLPVLREELSAFESRRMKGIVTGQEAGDRG
jgi:guanosine-3',5'-bis(diphosphate) 3'-pyrophosphohydrolase